MRFTVVLLFALMVISGVGISSLADIPPSMNVQGKLTDATGNPLPPGPKTITFRIFNAPAGGVELWPVVPGEDHLIVTDNTGLWNAQIGSIVPIPEAVFTDTAQWLELTVDDGIQPPVTLPRIKLQTGPSAFQSALSSVAGVSLSAGPNSVNSVAIIDGGIAVEDIGQNGAAPDQVLKWNGSQWIAANDSIASGIDDDWVLSGKILFAGGNWGISKPGSVILGNNDSTHVNLGVACTTGAAGQDFFGVTISGGAANVAAGEAATIAGGMYNTVTREWGFIGGGMGNTATHTAAVVSGGQNNVATGVYNVIGGGLGDSTAGEVSTIGGGYLNVATGDYSTIAGGRENTASGSDATIGGGRENGAPAVGATVGGGGHNNAHGQYSVIAGGGGDSDADSNSAVGLATVIGGGRSNTATIEFATVAGGSYNLAGGQNAVVGGGLANMATGTYATVSGGADHHASGMEATIAGGYNNEASSDGATVSGGLFNSAAASSATVGGGSVNFATGLGSTIGGGIYNTASGRFSVIAGGGGHGMPSDADTNSARGDWSMVPGGKGNAAAGNYSFAGGRRAIANHHGAFVWADSVNTDFFSSYDNEFAIRAGGGLRALATSEAYGASITNNGMGDGIRAYANVSQGTNWGALYAVNYGSSPAVTGIAGTGLAGHFTGDVVVTGSVTTSSGTYRIDHPLDPENMYLNHAPVESPDMMNVYNGNVTTDGSGTAVIVLPDYFEALNRDFRYQLTVIGQFAQAIVAEKITGNTFTIRTDKPNVEVSWQVTGVRQDAFAKATRLPVEEVKPAEVRGFYLHAEAHGQSRSLSIDTSKQEK